MDRAIASSTAILLAQPENVLNDKHNLIAISLVKGIDCFSKINKIAVTHRNKTISETRKEEIKFELTKALFYVSCLTHLLDFEPDQFDYETLKQFSESFYIEYKEDTILCSMKAIQGFITIADELYSSESLFNLEDSDPETEGSDEPEQETDTSLEGIPELVFIKDESDIDPVGDPEEDTEEYFEEGEIINDSFDEIFAAILLLLERFELDFESLLNNLKVIQKP